MLLEVKALTKKYGVNTVLDNVQFSIVEGGITGLIGPNGSGKTTLFEVLAGMVPADAGEVHFQGKLLPAEGRKKMLFYLPDGIRPWADQPVGWLLRFFAGLYGASQSDVLVLTESLQLKSLEKSRAGSLSKGELKRLLLAMGLLTPHPLLLLDEPFDGLDFRQTRDVMMLLKSFPSSKRTLFLSIHQLTDAARVCHRLVLLGKGRVVGQGTLEELQAQASIADGGLEEVFLALT